MRPLDPRVLARLRDRDPEALGTVVDLFAPKVYGFLACVGVEPDELDERAEEVLWTLWTWAGLDDDTGIHALLRRAVGSCLRRRRRQGPAASAGPGTWVDTMILLIEDNPDNQEIYRIILTHHGYSVLQAWDGEDGVRMARDHRPELILMDLTMPHVDGLEAARRLKADPATAAIPIIALTAQVEPETRAAAAAAGCVAFLSKPAPPQQVAAEVQRVLAAGFRGSEAGADPGAAR
jgi:two-component system cell cycle response regulator DivK